MTDMIDTDERAFRHLAEADSAFQAALQVRTRETLPADWATTQFNLGAAQVSHAERLGGEQATRLLEAGLNAIRAALQTLSVKDHPDRWATAQHNLGAGLAVQGQRQGGQKGFESFIEAARAFRAALQVRTPDDNLAGWSDSQFNLGSVLACQAQLLSPEQGIPRVLEAVAIFRKLLEVRTRESDPMGWARDAAEPWWRTLADRRVAWKPGRRKIRRRSNPSASRRVARIHQRIASSKLDWYPDAACLRTTTSRRVPGCGEPQGASLAGSSDTPHRSGSRA